MAGPSTANLSSYAPKREVFSDASGIVNAKNAGIGDANLSPLADIVDGVNTGLNLATKANAFIQSISPEAAEERRLNLEIKKSQAAIMQQQGQAAQIQAQADAMNKEILLQEAILKPQIAVNEMEAKLAQGKALAGAVNGLAQIQDIGSFDAFLRDPQYNSLRPNETFKSQVAATATRLINTTSDPYEQTKLYRTAAMASPGSEEILKGMLSTEAQRIIADPKELAEIDLKTAQAKEANAKAGQLTSQLEAEKNAATSPAAPYDPIAAALSDAGVVNPSAIPESQQAPGSQQTPGMQTSTTGAPVGQAQQVPGASQSTASEQQAKDDISFGQSAQKEGPPLTPEQQVTFDSVQERIKLDNQKKIIVDKILDTPGTPGERKFNALLKENIRLFPKMDDSSRIAAVKAQVEMTDIKPAEAEELGKFREATNSMEVNQMRMQAAFKTIDDFIGKHGDANLGPTEKIDRYRIMAVANAVGSEDEKKALVSAWAELDSQGLRNALTELATMKLGQTAIMMNTPQETEAQQAMFTGSNISYERNKQAFDIQTAKAKQAKGILAIITGMQILGRSYQDGVQVADRWRQTNNPLEVGQVNGIPEVQLKQPGSITPAESYLYDTMKLDKYMQRNQEGRVIPSKPADPHAFARDLSAKIDRGEKIPIPKFSDIADRMYEASPALILRTISQESSFDPEAISSKGAQGLMQLMPGTGRELWKEFGFEGEYDPSDKEKNILMGTKYLNKQLRDFDGDTRLALAAYNAGPNREGLKDIKDLIKAYNKAEEKMGRTDYNAVQHYLPKETKDYVKRIMGDGQPLDRGSLTEFEQRGAFGKLPTQKAQTFAQTNLSPEGVAALADTNNINRIADTKGTVLENVVSAVLSLNPFSASVAEAQVPDEEVGSADSRTRTLNDDGSVSVEGAPNPDEASLIAQQDGVGSAILGELNPFRGPDEANAETGQEALAKIDAAGKRKPKPIPTSTEAGVGDSFDDDIVAQSKFASSQSERGFDLSDGMQAVVLGAARGLLFGGEDEVFALARMAIHGETWEQATAQTRQIRDALQEAHPILYVTGNIAGGLTSPIPGAIFKGGASVLNAVKTATGIGKAAQSGNAISQARKVSEAAKLAKTSSLAGSIGKSTAVGAGFGGLTGFFEGEAGEDGSELSNRLDRGLQGAVFGAATGAVLGPLVYKMAKGAGSFTPEERSILKNMVGMSDKDLAKHIDELAKSGNPAGSVLAKMGIAKIKPYIDAIARNPNASADVINAAEENLGNQFARVAASVGQTKSSVEAAKDLAKIIKNKVSSFYAERSAQAKKYYTAAEEAAARNTYQSKSKFGKWRFAEPVENESVMFGGGATASTTAQKHDLMVDRALSKRQISRTTTTPEGIGSAPILDKYGKPVESPYNVYGVSESKVQRYRQAEAIPPTDRPAFISDEVFKVVNENPYVSKTLREAKRIVDPEDLLEANDFAVLQETNSILGRRGNVKTGVGGNEGRLYREAHEDLQSALHKENKLYAKADKEFKADSEILDAKYSKGIQKLEKYAAPDGSLDITAIHDDVMKLGSDELKSIMGNLSPSEKEVLRESVRAHITDTLKARGPRRSGEEVQKFPNFLKDMGDEKLRIVMGAQEGARISKMLQEEADISAVANRLIKQLPAAEKAFERQAQRFEDLSKADQTKFGASIGMMGVWGVNRYTSTVAAGFGIKALHSYIRSQKYANTAELAQGIADRLYLNPKAGLEFLEKVSNAVKTENPMYYPTWQKAVSTAAQMLVSGGNEGEPQTTARRNNESVDIYIKKGKQDGDK